MDPMMAARAQARLSGLLSFNGEQININTETDPS